MRIASMIHRSVVTCSDRDDVAHATHLMWEHDLGCIPVIDATNKVIGMITDRDIAIAAWFQARPLGSIAVSSVMAKEIITCGEDEDVRTVLHAMRTRQIHRVPVIDGEGYLLGVLSLNDLARAAVDGRLPAAEVVATLAEVSRPRDQSAAA